MVRNSDFSFPQFDGGGKFSSEGDWIHGTRVINTYELILVTHGTVYLEENGVRHVLRTNDYILLHPHMPHGGYRITKEPVSFYWLHFYSKDKYPLPFIGTALHPEILIQNARQLLQIHHSPAYPKQTVNHMMYVLLSELLVQRQQEQPQNALAVKVLEYIRAHSDRPLSSADVAAALEYHPDHLGRVLKAYCGTTLNKEIARNRLRRAKWLLQTTNYPVNRIAMELGYADANLFEKFFKYHTTLTPTAYRNSFSDLHTNHK